MATIREISEQIGVSPTTVSNVINGRTKKMSEETLLRVERALEQFHYNAGRPASTGNTQPMMIAIGISLNHEKNQLMDPFCGELIGAIEKKLHEYKRNIFLFTPESEEEILKALSLWNIEGLILLGWPQKLCSNLKMRCRKPVVFIDSYIGDGSPDYDNIGLQDYEGAYELVSYLVKQGHRKIAFFCDQREMEGSNLERLRGCRNAMRDAGLEFTDQDSLFIHHEKNLRHEILRQFLKKQADRYTAVFFCSDFYANDAINVFFSQGLEVPESLSVVGFDDNMFAQLSRPMLTTVRQSPTEKGTAAVRLLMQRLSGEYVPVSCLRLPTELIVRESVRSRK